jgi:SAM-dependent methyltransferase
MDTNSSEYRKLIWIREYEQRHNLPSTNTIQPSRALINFMQKYNPQDRSLALDLGSGNGRNSLYLAQQDFAKVVGVEIVPSAVQAARITAQRSGLAERVEFIEQSIGSPINLPDNSCSLIVDMMVMHSLNSQDRSVVISEIKRLLKPGGYFVYHTIAADSPAAIELIRLNPGKEPHSYTFKVENDTITEKAFTQSELVTMLSPLDSLEIERKTEFTPAFGDKFERVYYLGVARKVIQG